MSTVVSECCCHSGSNGPAGWPGHHPVTAHHPGLWQIWDIWNELFSGIYIKFSSQVLTELRATNHPPPPQQQQEEEAWRVQDNILYLTECWQLQMACHKSLCTAKYTVFDTPLLNKKIKIFYIHPPFILWKKYNYYTCFGNKLFKMHGVTDKW